MIRTIQENWDCHSVCVLSTCFRLIEGIIGVATLLALDPISGACLESRIHVAKAFGCYKAM